LLNKKPNDCLEVDEESQGAQTEEKARVEASARYNRLISRGGQTAGLTQ
jgi:hypothetical protein